jgi:hypothetical protein
MRARALVPFFSIVMLSACFQTEDTPPGDDPTATTYRWGTGPAADATVDIQDADFWYVPEFIGQSTTPGQNGAFVWTLMPPADGRQIKSTFLRQCHTGTEAALKLYEADRFVGEFSVCQPDLRMGTLTIAYDGTRWVPVDTGGDHVFMFPPDYVP